MRDRFIPSFITLAAGAVTSILNIINKVDMLTGLKRLFLVLIIFYIIGLIAKAIIKKAIYMKPKTEEGTGEEETKEEEAKEETKQDEKKEGKQKPDLR